MKILKEAGLRERIVAVLAFPFCGLLLILAGLYLYLAPQLPDADQLKEVRFETPLQVLSSDGQLIAEFGEKHTTPLAYEQIPPLFIKAILAAEDDRFFEHEGINYKGLARAFVDILREKRDFLSANYETCTQEIENEGHRFGEDLSEADKKALIAFLATL